MRIAQISVHACPLRPLGTKDTGGMNVYVGELSRQLGNRGIQVDVFTRAHNPIEPDIIWLGENTRLIHLPVGEVKDLPKEEIYCRLPEFISAFRDFQMREGATYSLLHGHYWLSAYAAYQLKSTLNIPQVTTFHTLGAVKNRARPAEKEPELRIITEREMVRESDRITALTTEDRDDLIDTCGADPEKIQIVPGGVDTELFHPIDRQQARRELGLGDGKILLFAGRLEPIKGIDLLLRAMNLLENHRELRLFIVGGDLAGNAEALRLRSLALELGISDRVTFYDAVEQEKMPLFYNAADICVVPSVHESFCLVALEAQACSTPVVASAVGGLKTVVRDGETGFLVNGHSPEAFAGRLERLLKDEAQAMKFGAAGRLFALEYQWSTIADKMLSIYRQIAGARCRCKVA